MRQVLLDELTRTDVARLKDFLARNAAASGMEGLYWVDLTPELLDPRQVRETADQPFCFAVEVGDDWAKFEFLIRSRHNLRSPGTRYANQAQLIYILDYSNRVIEELGLRT
ncbi:MAG: hypothetical protein AB1641_11920 [Thermodesulfobacteriota bacterium]